MVDMPDDEAIEAMARKIHENYDQHLKELDPAETEGLPGFDKTWDELPPKLKAQNRDQARDNIEKLELIGMKAVPADQAGDDEVESFSQEVVDRLAHAEHDRWSDQKRNQGYVYGSERCDDPDEGLTHPDLVAWNELDDVDREKDRRPVREMPHVLKAAGWAVVRTG